MNESSTVTDEGGKEGGVTDEGGKEGGDKESLVIAGSVVIVVLAVIVLVTMYCLRKKNSRCRKDIRKDAHIDEGSNSFR